MNAVLAKVDQPILLSPVRSLLEDKVLDNVLIVTHTDLDGAGCAIVAKHCIHNWVNIGGKIELIQADYDKIDEIAQKIYDESTDYDLILFADITPSEEIGRKLLGINYVFFIDHHKSREYLADYPGKAYYNTEDSATLILWRDFFQEQMIMNLLMCIDAWDSWKLDSTFRNDGVRLNYLFHQYGFDDFINEFYLMRLMTPQEKKLANASKNKDEQEMLEMLKNANKSTDETGYFLAMKTEKRKSFGRMIEILKTELPELYNATDYISIRVGDKVSLYSDRIDVSEIAKRRGGGGHAGAAGYHIKKRK